MLEDKILNDYKQAMKAKDSLKATALSFLRSHLINAAFEKRKDKLDDNEVISVIKKQIKERQDSIEQFKQGNRQDLVDKEAKELEILKSYLPEQLSTDKLKAVVEGVIQELGATSMKDMSKVMKEVMQKTGGAADGKEVSELVKNKLSPREETEEK